MLLYSEPCVDPGIFVRGVQKKVLTAFWGVSFVFFFNQENCNFPRFHGNANSYGK